MIEKALTAAGFALAAFLVALAGGVMALQSSLPPAHGTLRHQGLAGEVRLYFDAHGIPHIFAGNLTDAAFALGHAHAGDRLFQMMMTRRSAQGRLAEILGPDLVAYDRRMRSLGLTELAQANYTNLSADIKTVLQSYAAGVNAYLENRTGLLPMEFLLLGFAPEPWQPADGLLWAKLMSWQLSANIGDEVFRAQLLAKGWSAEDITRLYPSLDRAAPVTLRPLEWQTSQLPAPRAKGISHAKDMARPAAMGHASFWENLPRQASNIFVAAAARTKTGAPILANDPHLQLQMPALWYLARIVTPEYELKGATAPGLPLFLLGQNGHAAWGFTTSNIDVQDLAFVPAARARIVRTEKIAVRNSDAVMQDVRHVEGNLVVSDTMPDVAALTPPGHVAILLTTALDPADRTAQALFRINTAKDVGAIEAALPDYMSPPQNLMAADARGNIGYYAAGAVPRRIGHDGQLPGMELRWDGVAQDELTRLVNPQAGVIHNANNAQAPACMGCPPITAAAEPYRAMRLEALLREAGPLDAPSAAAFLLDTKSQAALRLTPRLLAQLKDKHGEAAKLLAAWDGNMDAGRPEPLLYHMWLDKLLAQVFGEAAVMHAGWPRLWALEAELESVPAQTIAGALDAAHAELRARFGGDMATWRWGEVHRAPLLHPVWSRVPLLKHLFDVSRATHGDGTTLRRAASSDHAGLAAFEDRHGAGYRGTYDLGDPKNSLFIIAGGQSGQPLSPHYGDLIGAWAQGRALTLTGDAASFVGRPALLFTP